MHWFLDHVILINTKLISEMVQEWSEDKLEYISEVNMGIWMTLIHELRHHQLGFATFTEEEIPMTENLEENVEVFARNMAEAMRFNFDMDVFEKIYEE